jgi:hypothetical protein
VGGGAWPFLVGGAICLVDSDNERDSTLLTSRRIVSRDGFFRGRFGVALFPLSVFFGPREDRSRFRAAKARASVRMAVRGARGFTAVLRALNPARGVRRNFFLEGSAASSRKR